MELLKEKSAINSRIIKTELINWRELQFIQNENFKELSNEAKHKLKASIVSNNFMQPFYIWEDQNGVRWCLDGKHRTLLLEDLINDKINVPFELPATFIQCETKKDAAKLVLLFSSQYAKVTQEGMFDFLTLNELDFSELKSEIDLPEFSELKFEQKFADLNEEEIEEDPFEVADENIIVKPGDIFQLGEHMLYCGSFENTIAIENMFQNRKARIVFTDPPYNLKADAFSNNGSVKHEDFAMASGEMNDDEFVGFLEKVMKVSCDHSVDGAIHYICMDWRHSWHMSEASLKIYGSVEPKNLVVWNKNNAGMGSFYRSKHEFVYVYKHGSADHLSNINLGDRYRSNVWDYPISTSFNNEDKGELKNHPTPKPVKMVADAVLDTTNEKDIVADWFVGSGTTIIACEITGRVCYATEIEPKFVQSTMLRYIKQCQKLGKVPTVKHLNGVLTLQDFLN